MRVGADVADVGGAQGMQAPNEVALGVGVGLERGQRAVPDPRLLPAAEAGDTVPQGPYRAGRSRHGTPVRSRWTMPSTTGRWFSAGRPVRARCGGRGGAKAAHRSSVIPRSLRLHRGYHSFENTP